MRLMIGSKRVGGTDGTIHIRGRRQIALEWGPFNAELQLTMDLYAPDARHIARLRRNQWTFNDHDRFEFTSRAGTFRLVDTKERQVALAGRIDGRDAVVITHGVFCSADGHAIEITRQDGLGPVDPAPGAAARPTMPPFALGEVAKIRKDAAASGNVLTCPRCGRTMDAVEDPQTASVLVTCPSCPGNLVIEPRS